MLTKSLEAMSRPIIAILREQATPIDPAKAPDFDKLRATLKPGDVLLVEGYSRISGMIRYLTQSNWSHAALYVGAIPGITSADGEPHVLVEAYAGEGVVSAPLSRYRGEHVRICRPIGLTDDDAQRVVTHTLGRIGNQYDLKNIFDLARYLVPLPVPSRYRRRMIALGSGDPTRAICSTMIAQAFESVLYPILPNIVHVCRDCFATDDSDLISVFEHKIYSLVTPADFDSSPYFEIVKPTIAHGFDYRTMVWTDQVKLRSTVSDGGLCFEHQKAAETAELAEHA